MLNPPLFPNSANLSLEYKDYIYSITSKFEPYSDFNFVSMYSNDTLGLINVSILNNNMVIKLQDYISGKYFYTFIGENDLLNTIKQVIEESIATGLGNYIKFIPEFIINSTTLPSEYRIIEDIGDHDYIISNKEVSECIGPKFHTNKKSINQFIKLHNNAKFSICEINDVVKNKIIELSETWRQQKNVSIEDSNIELTAIERIFDLKDACNLKLGIVEDNSQLIAFVFFEILDINYAIGHFGKSNREYRGIYQYKIWSLCKYLFENNIKYFNLEQDLGVEGLRISKKHWNPVKYLKKYKIEKII